MFSNCILTNLPIKKELGYDGNILAYEIEIGGRDIRLRVCMDCMERNKELEKVYHIFIGLFWTNRSSQLEKNIISWDKTVCTVNFPNMFYLKQEMEFLDYPKNSIQHKQNLLIQLVDDWNQRKRTFYWNNEFANKENFYFFKEQEALSTYLLGLVNEGFLNFQPGSSSYDITLLGLIEYDKLKESTYDKTKNCFVAMRFEEATKPIREAIRNAIYSTGFIPIFIDEVHHEPESTINDAMIARMKESKFCVADFTQQNKGVYFESGYMMGRGKHVIFTCTESDFKDKEDENKRSHFDTNHFPHLIYKTPDELKESLINTIKARII